MPDAGFVSGFIGVGIEMAINHMLCHINVAVRCRKELESLRDMLINLRIINSDMQMYQGALISDQFKPSENLRPASVDDWLRKLDMLLQEAAEMVRKCTIPRWNPISCYTMSKNISGMITRIKEHRENAALIGITTQLAQLFIQIQQASRETIASSSSSSPPPLRESTFYIGEPLVLGQNMVLTRLQESLRKTSRIGVLGSGGVGKTLLMKTLFNSQQVKGIFSNDLLLWLTISQTPSFHVMRQELVSQIAFELNKRIERLEGEQVKTWLQSELNGKKFILFLDDVWETSASSLFEELALPSFYTPTSTNSNVIVVSSRDRRALLQVGVPGYSIVDMQYLTENDSWQMFSHFAFPHSDGNLPSNISEEIARGFCKECGGLPLAIKVIARSMAGVLDSKEWELRLRRLQNAESVNYGDVTDSLYGRLRLSYDSLDKINISLQLCFLYVAAYQEDQVISSFEVSQLWMGEGLLEGEDQLQIGQIYVNLLADRCLIEATKKDIYGNVLYFRVQDVLNDLARQIAEKEENCFFRAGKCFQQFPAIDCSRHIRISLASCSLGSVPETFGGPDIRSWRMVDNHDLQIIPGKVIERMTSLRLLNLSDTSLRSLPDSIGSLKHLVCLQISGVPIERLPNSITSLKKLQILSANRSNIQELPSSISKLSSLKVLDISECKDLRSVPYGISQLPSLEYLNVTGSPNAWIEPGLSESKRDLLSINDLSSLIQLRRLHLEYRGETLQEGALGSLLHVENLFLQLNVMEKLPADMTAMTKLRKLDLECPQLTNMELAFCGFQLLGFLSLWSCQMLKEVPADLHKILSLKRLQIIGCHNIEKLPEGFGERGAFPKLEVFCLMDLDSLEELPTVEEAAMPALKTFTVAVCERLKMIPENYWNLRSVEKIRVYGCSMAVKEMEENFRGKIKNVQTITMPTAETRLFMTKFYELRERRREYRQYGEHWSNEFLMFLNDLLLSRGVMPH